MNPYQALKDILDKGERMVFFGGAGVSTESGIPDFRSESGLYHRDNPYGVAPEYLLSIDCLREKPDIFFAYHKENLLPADPTPNRAHRALALLEKQGKLAAIITQNVDGLHQLAGSRTVHELHGSSRRHYCMTCGAKYDQAYARDMDNWKEGIPNCAACGGTVRSDVVLYGEGLDQDCIEASVQALAAADVLIVGGTSLAVYPAAGLVRYFDGDHLVIINREATPMDSQASLVIREPIGEVLGTCLGVD